MSGAYFVTINCYKKSNLFGWQTGDEVELNKLGHIASYYWHQIPIHFPNVELDAFIVMPSHIHGIIFLNENVVWAQHAAPIRHEFRVRPGSLGAIVRSYKSAVSRQIKLGNHGVTTPIWHRNYYERIIRNERELEAIRNYVTYNAYK